MAEDFFCYQVLVSFGEMRGLEFELLQNYKICPVFKMQLINETCNSNLYFWFCSINKTYFVHLFDLNLRQACKNNVYAKDL